METKGLECKYVIKKCSSCKENKLIHNFTNKCKDCRKAERNMRDYPHVSNPIHREKVLAVRPSDKVFMEAENMRTLRRDLRGIGVDCKSSALTGTTSRKTKFKNKEVTYWYYKGLIVVFKKDYSEDLIEQIFLERLTRKNKPSKIQDRFVSDETKEKIAKILTLSNHRKLKVEEIADEVGMKRSAVSHILTGRSYGKITGIKYVRAYNKYGDDGDVLIPKGRNKKQYVNNEY